MANPQVSLPPFRIHFLFSSIANLDCSMAKQVHILLSLYINTLKVLFNMQNIEHCSRSEEKSAAMSRAQKGGNCCLTLHQPWASLLVHGIKRIEGRSWPAPLHVLSGRLWIHAAAKVPDASTIEAMENFYREIYNVDGVSDLKFPEHYPVSVLLGSVKVVGCLKLEELVSWEDLSQGVRLEGQTDFCWLCEDPQRLVVPFEMRGWQGVYNLETKIAKDAVRALRPIQGPLPVTFPLLDPSDSHSLRPGSLQARLSQAASNSPKLESTPSLDASIADARAAANQFRKEAYEHLGPSSQSDTKKVLETQSTVLQKKKGSTSSPQSTTKVAGMWVPKATSEEPKQS